MNLLIFFLLHIVLTFLSKGDKKAVYRKGNNQK